VASTAVLATTVPATAQDAQTISYSADFPGGVTEHVILVSIDGLRPDAIGTFDAPTLQRLQADGSSSMAAITIVPSKTLPSHTSMLTGVGPEVHGITWNSYAADRLDYVQVPTVFELAHAAGLSTAAFVAKAKFRHLLDPAQVDYFEVPAANATTWAVTRTVERAVTYMRHERPNLLFVHMGEPDFAGHTLGWMSPAYGWSVRQADAGVARLVEAADATYGGGGYTIVITADHGGHDRTHGSAAVEDRRIPWIAYGAGVRTEQELLPGIRTMDTAATVLWALGVPVPADWAGRPVVSAFETRRPEPVRAAAGN
jgi:predicted AlkP superfamily pyrophosphatase or phosphodiesterase